VFLLVLMSTPAYTGPAQAGQPFPQFTATRADGEPFTEDHLSGRKNTVLVFFRGRW
jgi:peroxiredoxin